MESAATLESVTRWQALRRWLAPAAGPAGERARTRRDALAAFAIRVASAGILYLSQIILARWMGEHEYGVYVSVWTWVLVLGGLSHFGFAMAMIRLLPVYRETHDLELMRGLLHGGRWFAFAVSSVVAALGMLALWLAAPAVTSPYTLPLFLALVCVPMYTLSDVHDGIGRGQAWMGTALVPPYILRPLLLLTVMIVAHEVGLAMSATTAAGAAILATWGAGLVQLGMVESRLRREIAPGSRRYAFGPWLKTAWPLLVIGLSEIVLQTADVLILARTVAPSEVGIYFAAAKTMSLIMFVHYAVGSAAANRFSALNARGDRSALAEAVRDAVHWTFWPSLAAGAALLALGWPLLWLFGPRFTDAYPVMVVLAIGFLVRASFGPVEFLLNMLGEQRRCAAVLAGAAVANVALNAALVPRFGLMGAAAATTLSLAAVAILSSIVARRRLGLETSIGLILLRRGREAGG